MRSVRKRSKEGREKEGGRQNKRLYALQSTIRRDFTEVLKRAKDGLPATAAQGTRSPWAASVWRRGRATDDDRR